MTALALGLYLISGAVVSFVLAFVIAYFVGRNTVRNAFQKNTSKNFLWTVPVYSLALIGNIAFWIGLIALVVALLQYLGVL